ncbi:MAG TPA: archease [Candidatus Babeliales bacterium]|nr:archease [Candidatus Babeliales bacterium]
MQKDFELLPHTADIKIRVYGTSLEQIFIHALIGMFQSIGPQASNCKMVADRLVCDVLPYAHTLSIDSPDREALLVDFLSDALYLSDVHNQAYLGATIHMLTDTHIEVTVYGVAVQGFEVVEIKAVTYHDLYIKQTADGWQAEIVFDI